MNRCANDRSHLISWTALVFCCAAGILMTAPRESSAADKEPLVARWERFEKTFDSSVSYANSIQEANLSAIFTSPSGENFKIHGFWDGGRTWRVRFSPNQPGKWTYKTTCSD